MLDFLSYIFIWLATIVDTTLEGESPSLTIAGIRQWQTTLVVSDVDGNLLAIPLDIWPIEKRAMPNVMGYLNKNTYQFGEIMGLNSSLKTIDIDATPYAWSTVCTDEERGELYLDVYSEYDQKVHTMMYDVIVADTLQVDREHVQIRNAWTATTVGIRWWVGPYTIDIHESDAIGISLDSSELRIAWVTDGELPADSPQDGLHQFRILALDVTDASEVVTVTDSEWSSVEIIVSVDRKDTESCRTSSTQCERYDLVFGFPLVDIDTNNGVSHWVIVDGYWDLVPWGEWYGEYTLKFFNPYENVEQWIEGEVWVGEWVSPQPEEEAVDYCHAAKWRNGSCTQYNTSAASSIKVRCDELHTVVSDGSWPAHQTCGEVPGDFVGAWYAWSEEEVVEEESEEEETMVDEEEEEESTSNWDNPFTDFWSVSFWDNKVLIYSQWSWIPQEIGIEYENGDIVVIDFENQVYIGIIENQDSGWRMYYKDANGSISYPDAWVYITSTDVEIMNSQSDVQRCELWNTGLYWQKPYHSSCLFWDEFDARECNAWYVDMFYVNWTNTCVSEWSEADSIQIELTRDKFRTILNTISPDKRVSIKSAMTSLQESKQDNVIFTSLLDDGINHLEKKLQTQFNDLQELQRAFTELTLASDNWSWWDGYPLPEYQWKTRDEIREYAYEFSSKLHSYLMTYDVEYKQRFDAKVQEGVDAWWDAIEIWQWLAEGAIEWTTDYIMDYYDIALTLVGLRFIDIVNWVKSLWQSAVDFVNNPLDTLVWFVDQLVEIKERILTMNWYERWKGTSYVWSNIGLNSVDPTGKVANSLGAWLATKLWRYADDLFKVWVSVWNKKYSLSITQFLNDAEIKNTLTRINVWSYKYTQDWSEFRNIDKLLPKKGTAYYQEWTVDTPWETHRAKRRLVLWQWGELFYTDDHYLSFIRLK